MRTGIGNTTTDCILKRIDDSEFYRRQRSAAGVILDQEISAICRGYDFWRHNGESHSVRRKLIAVSTPANFIPVIPLVHPHL